VPADYDASFLRENLAASLNNANLNLLGYTSETDFVLPFAGVVKRFRIIMTEARTAGTATFTVRKNGTAITTPAAQVINASTPQFIDAIVDEASATSFAKGDKLSVVVTTDAGWLPTTSDAIAIVTLSGPFTP